MLTLLLYRGGSEVTVTVADPGIRYTIKGTQSAFYTLIGTDDVNYSIKGADNASVELVGD